MTAFNVVRFRVKTGREQEFLAAHKGVAWPGLGRAHIVKTGERDYCIIGEWPDAETMAAARPAMIGTLNAFRETLEDLGEGRGVTDAISGPVAMVVK